MREILLGYAPELLGELLELGAELGPPHADDWWRSTDDAIDYAHWIDFHVEDLQRVAMAALSDPRLFVPANSFALDWAPWYATWKGELQNLESSFLARVNSWDHLVVRHAELRQFSDRARSLGLSAPVIEEGPSPGPLERTLTAASGLVWGLAALAAVAVLTRSRGRA